MLFRSLSYNLVSFPILTIFVPLLTETAPDRDTMSVRFEPKWPEDPNEDGFYMPKDEDARTQRPDTARTEVYDIISSTYFPSKTPRNTLAKFTLFPKLPFELRHIIWRYNLPRRRGVEVLYDDMTGECASPCSIPMALHVNSDARGAALESYELVFSAQKANAMVYFDSSVDALYIGGEISLGPDGTQLVSCSRQYRTMI